MFIQLDNLKRLSAIKNKRDKAVLATKCPYHLERELNNAYYACWSPKRVTRWAVKVGSDVEKMIAEILKTKKHPERVYHICLGISSLEKKYGPPRINQTCKKELSYELYSCKSVKNTLKRGLDSLKEKTIRTCYCPFMQISAMINKPLQIKLFGMARALKSTSELGFSGLGTNELSVSSWYEVIGDPTIANTICDRIVNNSYRIELNDGSVRMKFKLN